MLVNELFQWLLSVAAISTAVLLVGALILRMLSQPAERVRCIQCALTAWTVAMIVQYSTLLPSLSLPVLPAQTASVVLQDTHDAETISSTSAAFSERIASQSNELAVEEPFALTRTPRADTGRAESLATIVQGSEPSTAIWSESIWSVLQFGCVVGASIAAVGFLVLTAVGYWRLVLLRRRCELASPQMLATWSHATEASHRGVEVLVSSSVRVPLAFGIRRPVIVLPRQILKASDATTITYCLSHEWAHIRSHDVTTWWIVQVLQSILWFQPLFWYLRRELRTAQDQLADDFAVGDSRDRADYASLLTCLARQQLGVGSTLALTMAGRRSSLYRRVEMLLVANFRLANRARRRVVLCAAGCLTILAIVVGTVRLDHATATTTTPDVGHWQLRFPDDQEYGTVEEYEKPSVSLGFVTKGLLKAVHPAKGTISVSEESYINLKLNRIVSGNLNILGNLPEDSIFGLEISHCVLGAADVEQLCRLTKLRILLLDECSFAEGLDTDRVDVAASLEHLSFKAQEDDQIDKFVQWAARCPVLGFLYCNNRFLSATEVSHFANNSSASFLPVNISADAAEMFTALETIPNLRGLNLRVSEDAPDEYWLDLPKLRQVQHINWSGGMINDALLSSMALVPNIRSLTLQGSTVLAEDFPQGLIKLAKLERLTLHQRGENCESDDIHAALRELKHLKEWPKLKSPSKATLRAIASRADRTAIDIDGLGPDATADDLEAALSTDSLTHLELSNIPLSHEVMDAIRANTELEFLGLDVPEFDGLMFDGLHRLTQLKQINLRVDNRVSDLWVLSQLPNLERLSLNAFSLMPHDLVFILDCPQLQSISVIGGFSDDSTAKWIGKSKTLTSASLLQDCYMTDAAPELLCKNTRLESLGIGGLISKQAALKFKDLPRLTRLTLWSDLMSDADRELLKAELDNLTYTDFREFFPSSGKYVTGQDGIWRLAVGDDRTDLDALEGKHVSELLPKKMYADIKSTFEGKVVLIDFWGTWCGSCLRIKPNLAKLFRDHEAEGFQLVSIHSARGLDRLEEYLKAHPVLWTNLRDENGDLAKSFHVSRYPSLFLFDRTGTLRVAGPHRLRLEDAVDILLNEQ